MISGSQKKISSARKLKNSYISNENETYQNLWDIAKAVLRGSF
jgi:hypothetical protein